MSYVLKCDDCGSTNLWAETSVNVNTGEQGEIQNDGLFCITCHDEHGCGMEARATAYRLHQITERAQIGDERAFR